MKFYNEDSTSNEPLQAKYVGKQIGCGYMRGATECTFKGTCLEPCILTDKHIINNPAKNACCETCVKCELYENENTIPPDKYFCKSTEDFINDIEQHWCMDYESE